MIVDGNKMTDRVFLISMPNICICLVGSRIAVFEAVRCSLPPGANNTRDNHQCQCTKYDKPNIHKWVIAALGWVISRCWQLPLRVYLIGLHVIPSATTTHWRV